MPNKTNVFDSVFDRLLGLGITSQKGLAEILDITTAAVWKARNENRFPKKWVPLLCRHFEISPEWLLYGNEEGLVIGMQAIENINLVAIMDKLVRMEAQRRKQEKTWDQKFANSEKANRELKNRLDAMECESTRDTKKKQSETAA